MSFPKAFASIALFVVMACQLSADGAKTLLSCDFSGPYASGGPGGKDQFPKDCVNNYEWGRKDIDLKIVKDESGKPVQLADIKSISSGAFQLFLKGFSVWRTKYYRVNFRMKAEGVSGKVNVMVRKIGGPWTLYVKGLSIFPSSEWKSYSFCGKSSGDADSDLGVLFETGSVGRLWIGDVSVEELSSDPDAARESRPPVLGNLLPRSSFEADGDYFWCAGVYGQPGIVEGEMDDPQPYVVEGGKFGSRCLAFPSAPRSGTVFLRSFLVPVSSGKDYAMKIWCKSDKPGSVLSANVYSAEDGKPLSHASFKLGSEWSECSLRAKIPAGVQDIYLSFDSKKGSGTSFLDGASFAIDDLSDGYKPAFPFELSVATSQVRGNLYYWGQSIPLKLRCSAAAPDSAQDKMDAVLKVTAYPDIPVLSKKVELEPGKDLPFDLAPGRNGLFRIELLPEDSKLAAPQETLAALLPEPRATGAESFFGTHITVRPYFINYAKRVGFKWLRLHDASAISKWSHSEPERGKDVFFDFAVDELKRNGFQILGLPDDAPLPKWASGANASEGSVIDLKAYEDHCRRMAAHYKGRIDCWEVWNEPYMKYFFPGTPSQFKDVFIAGAKGLRAGNPQAKILGICPELSGSGFVKAVGPEVWDYADAISFHMYFQNITGNGERTFAEELSALKAAIGKKAPAEAWNSEGTLGEAGGNSFYSFLKAEPQANENAVAFSSRMWMESAKSGIAKSFIYTIHQSDTVMYHGGLKMMIGFDRSITPAAVSNAVCAWFIDGLKPMSLFDEPGVKESWFAGPDRQVWAVYADQASRETRKLRFDALPASWLVMDTMGNDPRKDGSKEQLVGIKPLFVMAPADAEGFAGVCKAALSK